MWGVGCGGGVSKLVGGGGVEGWGRRRGRGCCGLHLDGSDHGTVAQLQIVADRKAGRL